MNSFTISIIDIDEYGAGVLAVTPEELAEAGFDFGDVISLYFSTGLVIENIPYYNGYYVPLGDPVVTAYPGYAHPTLGFNGANFHRKTGITSGDSVTITLVEKGGKKDVMDIRGVRYSNDPADYKDEDTFANAREFAVGTIGKGKICRCASPFDHMMNRPEAVSRYLEKKQVKTTISLSESPETLAARYPDMPPYAKSLYENNCVVDCGLGSDYFSDEFCSKLVSGLIRAMEKPMPWAIHCLEGKDRTGFLCILLGALMDADYRELLDDYMESYNCYYGITEESDPVRYNCFKSTFIDVYLRTFAGLDKDEDPAGHSYREGAEAYLRRGGMSDAQIEKLKQILSGSSD